MKRLCEPSSMNWATFPKEWPRRNPKKIPETDAIFDHMKEMNEAADEDLQTLRISMDVKAMVKIGPFSRRGKSRVAIKAADHDFFEKNAPTVTPIGIFLPELDELFLYAVTSKVTSDCLVDRLVEFGEMGKDRFSHFTTLVLNLDNGPENNSHRTQFMKRLVEFSSQYHLTTRLANSLPITANTTRSNAVGVF